MGSYTVNVSNTDTEKTGRQLTPYEKQCKEQRSTAKQWAEYVADRDARMNADEILMEIYAERGKFKAAIESARGCQHRIEELRKELQRNERERKIRDAAIKEEMTSTERYGAELLQKLS